MLAAKNILLAYHSTDGARLAEELAFHLIASDGGGIVHLLVVPDLWADMQGDWYLSIYRSPRFIKSFLISVR